MTVRRQRRRVADGIVPLPCRRTPFTDGAKTQQKWFDVAFIDKGWLLSGQPLSWNHGHNTYNHY